MKGYKIFITVMQCYYFYTTFRELHGFNLTGVLVPTGRAARRGGAGGAIAPPIFRNKGAKICISYSFNTIALEFGLLILKHLISFSASIYNM